MESISGLFLWGYVWSAGKIKKFQIEDSSAAVGQLLTGNSTAENGNQSAFVDCEWSNQTNIVLADFSLKVI